MPDVTIETKAYWNEVAATQEYPQLTQCDEGFQWLGGMEGQVLPTAMKSIPRPVPPPKPAGLLEKVDWGTKQRWEEDSFRHPLISISKSSSSHQTANEKELLLGLGYKHTAIACPASKIKQNTVGFSDLRSSLLGDSFSVYSFVVLAIACCRKHLPVIPCSVVVQRVWLAPGIRAGLKTVVPWPRGDNMGLNIGWGRLGARQ